MVNSNIRNSLAANQKVKEFLFVSFDQSRQVFTVRYEINKWNRTKIEKNRIEKKKRKQIEFLDWDWKDCAETLNCVILFPFQISLSFHFDLEMKKNRWWQYWNVNRLNFFFHLNSDSIRNTVIWFLFQEIFWLFSLNNVRVGFWMQKWENFDAFPF